MPLSWVAVTGASSEGLVFCSMASAARVAQLLVMHRSLRQVLPGARTKALCMDRRTLGALTAIAPPGLELVGIDELERRDPGLAAVRGERSPAEYAWTAKPAFCVDILKRDHDCRWLTYVDADTMFFSDPLPALAELEGASIGLLPHAFAPRFRGRERWAGPYCASWVSLASDQHGREAAIWWRARCIARLSSRSGPEGFADQGYLEDFPRRFPGVRVFGHPGVSAAPWTRHEGLRREDGALQICGEPLILFHYQSLSVHRPHGGHGASPELASAPVPLTWRVSRDYEIPAAEHELVWAPYLRRLGEAIAELASVEPSLGEAPPAPGVRARGRALRQHLWMRRQELYARLRPQHSGAYGG